MRLRFAPHVLSVLALFATAAVPSHAAFINGDFSSNTLTNGGAITGTSTNGVWPGGQALGAGWIRTGTLWSITGGEVQRLLSTGVTGLQGVAQVVTDSKATTGELTLSFDYSIVIGTSQSTTYTIRYDVVGTDTSATSGSLLKITTTAVLLGGSLVSLGTGTLTGLAANTSGTVTGTINFASGYNYVGIRLIGAAEGGQRGQQQLHRLRQRDPRPRARARLARAARPGVAAGARRPVPWCRGDRLKS